jgi:hypothetical protein
LSIAPYTPVVVTRSLKTRAFRDGRLRFELLPGMRGVTIPVPDGATMSRAQVVRFDAIDRTVVVPFDALAKAHDQEQPHRAD